MRIERQGSFVNVFSGTDNSAPHIPDHMLQAARQLRKITGGTKLLLPLSLIIKRQNWLYGQTNTFMQKGYNIWAL